MLIVKQLVNGRFQVTDNNYDTDRFSWDVIAKILWQSWATKEEAEEFIALVDGPKSRNEFVESCLHAMCKSPECSGFDSCNAGTNKACIKSQITVDVHSSL